MWRDNREQEYSYLGVSITGKTVESFTEMEVHKKREQIVSEGSGGRQLIQVSCIVSEMKMEHPRGCPVGRWIHTPGR